MPPDRGGGQRQRHPLGLTDRLLTESYPLYTSLRVHSVIVHTISELPTETHTSPSHC